jgi:hypothetical protein
MRPGMGDQGCDAWNDTSEVDLSFSTAIKPRLVLAFDTSGSMNWNVCTTDTDPDGGFEGTTHGDGSLECPGDAVPCCNDPPGTTQQCRRNNQNVHDECDSPTCENALPDDSRLYKVKVGVYDAVAAYGEMEYSLYRFNAVPRTFACPGGGWGSGGSSCSTANRLVKFSPENQEYILQWMDHTDNWDGGGFAPAGLDFELRGNANTPLGATLNQIRSDLDTIRTGPPIRSPTAARIASCWSPTARRPAAATPRRRRRRYTTATPTCTSSASPAARSRRSSTR